MPDLMAERSKQWGLEKNGVMTRRSMRHQVWGVRKDVRDDAQEVLDREIGDNKILELNVLIRRVNSDGALPERSIWCHWVGEEGKGEGKEKIRIGFLSGWGSLGLGMFLRTSLNENSSQSGKSDSLARHWPKSSLKSERPPLIISASSLAIIFDFRRHFPTLCSNGTTTPTIQI